MTQKLQKLKFQPFSHFQTVFFTISSNFLGKKGFKNQHWLNLVFSRRFGRYHCKVLLELVSKHPEIHLITKKHVFWQIIPNFCKTAKIFAKKNFHWPERSINRVFRTQFRKRVGWSSSSLQQRGQNFLLVSIFDSIVSILDTFRNFTSIRKPIGSGWKHAATGSVSRRNFQKLHLKT